MAVQLGTTVRNARLDQIEASVGTAPHFYVRSGAQPADCGTADSGSVIIDLTLPSDWLAAASGGTKAKAGSWSGSATGTFTAGHFRIKDSGATVCHMQGSCGQGSGDLSFDNSSVVSGQTVTINTFTLTEGNA
jgi:hypothetical protein